MKNFTRILSLIASTCLAFSSAAGAGLVNGSFEAPVLSSSILGYSTAPAGFGWVIDTGDVDACTADYWQAAHGRQSIDMNGVAPASIYQDLTFSNTGAWTVTFDLSANPDLFTGGDGLGTGLKTMRVDFGIPGLLTNLGTYSLDASPRSTVNMDWVTITTPQVIVSNADVYRLQFTSLSEGIAGPVLDNVKLSRCESSTLRVSEVEFCWNSAPERRYQVQYRSALTTNRWVDLLSTNVPGTGSTICIPDRVAGQTQRFYRVLCLEE